ncbi:MAG: DUF808 domain-containing protein [Xenophilus sp.]
MAASLLLLLDDIASVLDDVSVLAKVAARKTAGVLGDDLALNAQQVAGVEADRELPVVWAVAKGSLVNKAILVPAALAIAAWLPWLITPLLMVGGAFLCFEGVEKLAHPLLHRAGHAAGAAQHAQAMGEDGADPAQLEKGKVQGAVRTDFILSAEIIVITLGTVTGQPFWTQFGVMAAVAVAMTAGVYGIVAGIVKLDDLGLHLSRRAGGGAQAAGRAILAFAPWLMKALSVAGTAAMFLVGGGILVHGVPGIGHAAQSWAGGAGPLGTMGLSLAVGLAAGAVLLGAVALFRRLRGAGA